MINEYAGSQEQGVFSNRLHVILICKSRRDKGKDRV